MAAENSRPGGSQGNSEVGCRTVKDYLPLIEAISVQEYRVLHESGLSFRRIVRLAALTVHVAILSRQPLNINLLSHLIRQTLRQQLEPFYPAC